MYQDFFREKEKGKRIEKVVFEDEGYIFGGNSFFYENIGVKMSQTIQKIPFVRRAKSFFEQLKKKENIKYMNWWIFRQCFGTDLDWDLWNYAIYEDTQREWICCTNAEGKIMAGIKIRGISIMYRGILKGGSEIEK